MALPGGMSMIYMVGLILLALGLLLHIIGLATPEWSVLKILDDVHAGLWRGCGVAFSRVICGEYTSKSAKVEACEAFALIGMLLGIGGLALVLLNVMLGIMGKGQNRLLPLLGGACCFGAFGAILLTCIIWGAGIHDSDHYDIGYSFALSIVGGILMAVAGALVIVGGKQTS